MVRIHAPLDTWLMQIGESVKPLNAQEGFLHVRVEYVLRPSFIEWCNEHNLVIPIIQHELVEFGDHVHTHKYLCFPSDADAVHFTLLWEKGCAST